MALFIEDYYSGDGLWL